MMKQSAKSVLALGVAAAFMAACADPMTPDRVLVENGIARVVTPAVYTFPPGFPGITSGNVELCKVSNVPGTFDFAITVNGVAQPLVSIPANTSCVTVFTSQKGNVVAPDVVVITENPLPAGWTVGINTTQFLANITYAPPRLSDVEDAANRTVTLYINKDMARRTTFTNTFSQPPVGEVCDFVTFGRLVTEVNGQKVVISGNVGGLNANGSIKNEFHVEANGVDNHVADAISYGPIVSGALSGPNFPNSRMAIGTAKNGVLVELRVWDGGEPGKGTDWVYVKLNGVEIFGATGKVIDQGNMQYHPNCRGPGDGTSVSTTSNGKKKG